MSTGSAAYGTSTTYAPTLSIGGTRTVRAGAATAFTNAASFASSGDGSFASFFWTATGATSTTTPRFSSRTSTTPSITFPTAGTYTVRLTGIDSVGLSTVLDTTIGVVAGDSVHRVITGGLAANTEIVTGPQVRQGTSPWDWFDSTYLSVSTALCAAIPAMPGATLQAGTISVTNGSNIITGSGTSFNTLFTDADDVIVVHYATGHQRARAISLTSISATHLEMEQNWDAGSGTISGLSYGKTTSVLSNAWTSGNTNWNYYDAVLGLYKQYYRTGRTEFRTCARDLADKFWTYSLDSGDICDTGTDCQPPRNQGLIGMMLRANDGQAGIWPGILKLVDKDRAGWITGYLATPMPLYDVREHGYAFEFLAAAAALHPTGGMRTTYQGYAEIAFGYFQSRQYADGAWKVDTADPNPGLGNIGIGTFPWQFFPIFHAMQILHGLNADPAILTVLQAGVGYLDDQGWSTITNCYRVRYGTEMTQFDFAPTPDCPYSGGTIKCATDQTCPIAYDSNRALNNETIDTHGFLYSTLGTAAYKTRGDLMFGATFGYTGTGLYADGGAGTFNDFVAFPGSYYAKEYAMVAGSGRAEGHLAYRNGPLSAATNSSLSIGFSCSGLTSCAQLRATVTMPSTATATATCTSSPCVVAGIDTRQGADMQVRYEYLTSGGAVITAGDQQSVTIP